MVQEAGGVFSRCWGANSGVAHVTVHTARPMAGTERGSFPQEKLLRFLVSGANEAVPAITAWPSVPIHGCVNDSAV